MDDSHDLLLLKQYVQLLCIKWVVKAEGDHIFQEVMSANAGHFSQSRTVSPANKSCLDNSSSCCYVFPKFLT